MYAFLDRLDPDAIAAIAAQAYIEMAKSGYASVAEFHYLHHDPAGKAYADPAELDCAVQEAELVLEVLHHSGVPIADEIGGGTYKLLFRMLASHPEEVRSFYEVTIAPVVRYDDQYRTDLLHTLQAYLDANCNMNATAATIIPDVQYPH